MQREDKDRSDPQELDETVEPSKSKKIKLENLAPSLQDSVGLPTVETSEEAKGDLQPKGNYKV